MSKKLCILFIGFLFILTSFIFTRNDEIYKVIEVISPTQIILDNGTVNLSEFDYFDTKFTPKNKHLAEKFNMTEEEAFIMGNLGKYWAENLLKGRLIYLKNGSNIIYLKFDYKEKFKYSGFCLNNDSPCYIEGFDKRLNSIRRSNYAVLDLDNDTVYDVTAPDVKSLEHFLVIKKVHLPRHTKKNNIKPMSVSPKITIGSGKIQLFLTDLTTKLKPDRNCNNDFCRALLDNINKSQESIDMAIYGYSRVPDIEKALTTAKNRGVKIRLVYDSDTNNGNIYPDTDIIKQIIPDNMSDKNSDEAKNIMHNKFYIFDNKILITGSANLSHTDMSGFNSNSMVIIKSEEIAKIYTKEFENMFRGKFHNDKTSSDINNILISDSKLGIYFSPQNKSIKNGLVPLINNAQKYIYVPTFIITDKNITSALISAKQRGVDVKIIVDALNASIQHSKHKELREGGIPVKTENYAGKMHSKSIIIDDKYTIIGSMNFSNSGENKNDENMLIIENTTLAKTYREFFLYQWNKIDNKWLKLNAKAEGKDSVGSCTDGIDNNYNGLTDQEDPACK